MDAIFADMGRRKPKRVENISIIDFAVRGKTIGKDEEGHVYMLEGPVPGDVVTAVHYKNKKGLRIAKVISYNQLSDNRVEAKCAHFGVCGGCKWQHYDYQSQLYYKEKFVRDAIERLAHLDGNKVETILPCKDIYYYRNKIEYTFCNSRWITEEEAERGEEITDRDAAGFHRPGVFNKVVNIDTCHLQKDLGNQIRNYLNSYAKSKGYSYFDYQNHSGLIRNLTLRNTSIDEWMVSVIFRDNDPDKIEDIMSNLNQEFPQITSLYYVINQKKNDTLYDQQYNLYKGKQKITEQLGEIKYEIGPKSFFQTNSAQAKSLFDVATEFAEFEGNEIVYDLYTGLGSIALYIADKCKYVVGIEEIPQAIEDAHINKKLNDIKNADFYAGDVKDVLDSTFAKKHGKPDIVITDPPRAGMHEKVVSTIRELSPQKIVYISCNPATQARDIKMLSEEYELTRVKPVDMFPHTQHIESVALLLKK